VFTLFQIQAWDIGRFRLYVSRFKVTSFVGTIGIYLNKWPLFKIELECELGVLPPF
jgi:hypothetical protein